MVYLNPRLFFPNPYALPVALLSLLVVTFGIVVLTREHGSTVGWLFFGFSVSVGLYFFGAGVSYATTSSSLALVWERVAHTGVVAIPAGLFTLTLAITGRRHIWRLGAAVSAAVTLGFLLLVVFSDWFITGNTQYYWGFYPQYGFGGLAFLVWFAAVMVASLLLHVAELRRAQTTLHRHRIRGMIIAFAIGYLGAVDFLPAIGVEVYAFGYVPVFVFTLSLGVVILRYRLVDITPAVAASQILATMPSGVLVTDTMDAIQIANTAAESLFSGHKGPLTGMRITTLLPELATGPEDGSQFEDGGIIGATDVAVTAADGSRRMVSIRGSTLVDGRRREIGRVYLVQDVTEIRTAAEELRRLALYDPLTGLPNRALFFDRVEHAMNTLNRDRGTLALFYIDLNGFKAINDRNGHPAGDSVLRTVAERMQSTIRASDTLARVGGDEFVQVSAGIHGIDDARGIAEKLIASLDEPIELGTQLVHVGASVGIALFPDHGSTIQELLNAADSAMYRAKAEHGSRYQLSQRRGDTE